MGFLGTAAGPPRLLWCSRACERSPASSACPWRALLDRDIDSELRKHLVPAREGELSGAELDARLETLHMVFFGEDGKTAGMVARRQTASKAHPDLTEGIGRHHDLERLSGAFGIALRRRVHVRALCPVPDMTSTGARRGGPTVLR